MALPRAAREARDRELERIFEFGPRARPTSYWGPRTEAPVQAVFWELRPEEVRAVRRFVAR